MQSVLIQLSALSGLLMFLQMAWTQAPLEQALLQGAGTGLAVYLVAIVGLSLVRHILTYTPEPEAEAPKEKVEIDGASASPSASPDRSAEASDAAGQRAPARSARETAVAS